MSRNGLVYKSTTTFNYPQFFKMYGIAYFGKVKRAFGSEVYISA